MLTITKKHEEIFKSQLNIKETSGKYEEKLIRKAYKIKYILDKIPWILSVCIGNSVAMNNAHKDSDIDLFIITRKNRIWTSRIILTFILFILRQRKNKHAHAWKFCLSFFIDETHLSLESIAIKNDIYLFFWISSLIPITNKENTFEKFMKNNSSWCKIDDKLDLKNSTKTLWKTSKFSTSCWDFCEKLCKSIFLPRTKKSFQKLWKPFWVIIWDNILKFHDADKRIQIRDSIM